ncbi:MAG: SDR family oxidoreductase [Actinomycetes bacterium]
MQQRTILVAGATGYIGGRLVPELLAAGYAVRCLARTPAKLADRPWRDQVEVVRGDVLDGESLDAAMAGCHAAYYLVHSMDGEGGFAERDRRAARTFRDAAARSELSRIVYLGGLGHGDEEELSDHLRSRQEVGRVLADGPVPVTELRAAIIIGSGSASFEMLRNLVEVLPVMTTPIWVRTRCQPIAIRDILHYLVAVLEVEGTAGRVLEVGGPDVLTYEEMMQAYAEVAGLRRRVIIPVPVLSPTLSSLWIGLVTPLPTGLARPLVESLTTEVVVRDHAIDELIPRDCLTLQQALHLAMQRVQDLDVATTWASADLGRVGLVSRRERAAAEAAAADGRATSDADEQAGPAPHDPSWAGGTVVQDEQVVEADAPAEVLFRTVCGIGGTRGYYAADILWDVRGLIDKVLGGIGTRRGRRHPDTLSVGEPLDFWRVEALETPELLRLRAEMKVPGDAWLEFRVVDAGGGRSRLEQRARFHPWGLWGRLYWLAMVPFHRFIFPVMARRLVAAAEHRASLDRLEASTARRAAAGEAEEPRGA